MKENIENYRKDGFIDLDEYLTNNGEGFIYPYFLDGYSSKNFWTRIRKDDGEKYVYVRPKETNSYGVYSELLYEELMKQVGLECANYDIAKFDLNDATISENVLDGFNVNEFILTSSDLLSSNRYSEFNENNIEDLFDTIHEYSQSEGVSNEDELQCYSDIEKLCIADVFTLATDRTANDIDFIAGVDDDGNEILKLAPSCHNNHALGSNFTDEEIEDMLYDRELIESGINESANYTIVPEYERKYGYPVWEDTLDYFTSDDDENYEFAKKCAYNMNIDDAITNVENKIKSEIPSDYKEFVRIAFNERLRDICDTLNLDYNKVMDNKYYEYEMEEI